MKGKIISISPKMKGNEQESFTANDKTFYVFIVSVEVDGTVQVGDANSTLQQPKWETNKECEVTVEKNDKATGGNRFRFNFGDRPGFQGGGRSYGKSVEERAEIISQSSYSTAIKYIESLEPDERKLVMDKYGPDDAYEKFANSISDRILKNAKRIKEEHMS